MQVGTAQNDGPHHQEWYQQWQRIRCRNCSHNQIARPIPINSWTESSSPNPSALHLRRGKAYCLCLRMYPQPPGLPQLITIFLTKIARSRPQTQSLGPCGSVSSWCHNFGTNPIPPNTSNIKIYFNIPLNGPLIEWIKKNSFWFSGGV